MIRIQGGEFRGRLLETPGGRDTRPTQAKTRAALINSLQTVVPGARVLELFAGSGALGFEALSRGAEEVVFVESSGQAVTVLKKNIRTLGLENRARVLRGDVFELIREILKQSPFDLVLADPPYAKGFEIRLLEELPWGAILQPSGAICLEVQAHKKTSGVELPDQVGCLVKTRQKTYGEGSIATYIRS